MKRRAFLTLIGGAMAAWPLAARAQQSAMPVIGFLDGQSFDPHLVMAFRQALKDAGYINGGNVEIYYRSADGQVDRLLTLAGDMVGRRVAVIVTTGGAAAALAAYAATTTIPIVFASGADPIASGLVSSLNRPGSNATGVYIFQQVLEGKRLGLLRGLVPPAALIAVLLNPTNANFQAQLRGVQDAARDLGQQVSILSASNERDIDAAFATVTQSRAGALLVGSTRSLTTSATRSLRWQRAMPFRRSMKDASLPWPAAWRATAPASPMPIVRPASTPAGFSGARSLPICPSCSQLNSSS